MTMTMPVFLLGHYMRLSMDEAGLSVEHMAEQLGVSRTTVSRWLNNKSMPRPGDLALWAQLTHVSTEWLHSAPVARPEGLEPPTFWLGADPGAILADWHAWHAIVEQLQQAGHASAEQPDARA